jgi:hypothetical protein
MSIAGRNPDFNKKLEAYQTKKKLNEFSGM